MDTCTCSEKGKTHQALQETSPCSLPSFEFQFQPWCSDAFFPILLAENIKPVLCLSESCETVCIYQWIQKYHRTKSWGIEGFFGVCVCVQKGSRQSIHSSAAATCILCSAKCSLVQSVLEAFSSPRVASLCPTHKNPTWAALLPEQGLCALCLLS